METAKITVAPFYVTNATLQSDLKIPSLYELSKSLNAMFFQKLHDNPSNLIRNQADPRLGAEFYLLIKISFLQSKLQLEPLFSFMFQLLSFFYILLI